MTDEQPSDSPSTEAPIPVKTTYPIVPADSSSLIPPQILKAVANLESDELLALYKDCVKQEYQLRTEELNLRKQDLANSRELAMLRERRYEKAETATQNNIRLIIAAVTLSFLTSLGYGALVKDSSLADRIFTGALGLLGGGGGVTLLQKSSEKEKDKP